MQSLFPPEIAQAMQFLRALDPDPAAQFGFRTFDDRGDNPRLSVKAYGTLEHGIRQSRNPAKNGTSCKPVKLLRYMQQAGAGSFAVINTLDGRGQKIENVVAIRALFVDADSRPEVERLQAFLATTGLIPTVMIASGGTHEGADKLQCYWRITDCPVSDFRAAQLTLVSRLGTDPAVQDAGRVMRLPGFWHQKREPRQTRIVSISDKSYYYSSFLTRIKAEPQIIDPWAGGKGGGQPTMRGRMNNSGIHTPSAAPTERLRALLHHCGGLISPAVRALLREAVAPSMGRPGNRHATLLAITARCMHAGWPDSDVRALVLPIINTEWNDGDWSEHLDSILGWTQHREAAAVAAMPSAPADIVAAFSASSMTGGVR